MKDKEVKQDIKNLQIVWWIMAITFSIVFLIAGIQLDNHAKRLLGVECAAEVTEGCKHTPQLDGWSEECIQNKTVTYLRQNLEVMNQAKAFCLGKYGVVDINTVNETTHRLVIECYFSETEKHSLYNETVCTKKMLVKEVTE